MSWEQFVNFLTDASTITVAVNFLIGIILSFLVEYFPKYHEAGQKNKRLLFILFSFLIPFAGYGLGILTNVSSYVSFQESIWPLIYAGFIVSNAGVIAHTRKLK